MLTSVKKSILDNSISGDKIFGGSINWIDQLYTDELYVPHTGTNGVGTIDGNGFNIGATEAIGFLGALNISGLTSVGLLNNSLLGFSVYTAQTGTGGYTLYRFQPDISDIDTLIGAGLSYFKTKLIVGREVEFHSGFDFESKLGFIETLSTNILTVTGTSSLGTAKAKDHNAVLQPLSEDLKIGQTVSTFLLNAPTNDALKQPWLTFDGASNNAATSVVNIGGNTIPALAWPFVATMDQDVDTTATVEYAEVRIGGSLAVNGVDTVDFVDWSNISVRFGTLLIVAEASAQRIGRQVMVEVRGDNDTSYIDIFNGGGGQSSFVEFDMSGALWDVIFARPILSISSFRHYQGIIHSGGTKNSDVNLTAYYNPFVNRGIRMYSPYVGTSIIVENNFTIPAGETFRIGRFSFTFIIDTNTVPA